MRISPLAGLNETALAMTLMNTCDKRLSMPGTIRPRPRSAISSTTRGAPSARVVSCTSTSACDIAPIDIVLDDHHEAPPLDRILDARGGLDRAAQRGERVLDLVRDIGGKALDRAHALPQ